MFKWKKMRAVLSLSMALSWWGIWFPELAVWTEAVCVADETAQQCYERSAGEAADQSHGTADETAEQLHRQTPGEAAEYKNAREIYDGLLHAQRDQIQIKSRLLQIVEKYFSKK